MGWRLIDDPICEIEEFDSIPMDCEKCEFFYDCYEEEDKDSTKSLLDIFQKLCYNEYVKSFVLTSASFVNKWSRERSHLKLKVATSAAAAHVKAFCPSLQM